MKNDMDDIDTTFFRVIRFSVKTRRFRPLPLYRSPVRLDGTVHAAQHVGHGFAQGDDLRRRWRSKNNRDLVLLFKTTCFK